MSWPCTMIILDSTRPFPKDRAMKSVASDVSILPAIIAVAIGILPANLWAEALKDNAPATPALETLASKESVSQYGVSWTFDKPARIGRFINGDWYVVG